MRHLKRVTALLVSMTVLAAVLLGIGVASAFTTAVDNDSGSSSAAASNSASEGDTVSAVIDMYWNAVDKDGDALFGGDDKRIWTQDASEYRDACASSTTARIIRNGVDVAELSFDGKVDESEQSGFIGGDAFTWRETSPWHIEVIGLPKKDSDGYIYSYLIVQNQIDGFVSNETKRETNAGGSLIACFYNYRSNGSAPTIVPISACWKDGGDVESRKPIEVALHTARAISGYRKDAYICSAELNEENSWYAEVIVPVPGLRVSNDDFYICELSTYDGSGSTDDKYEVKSRSEIVKENIDSHTYDSLLRYWPETDTEFRMISADPVNGSAYRVTYGTNSTVGSFEVTNQRVGSVEVSVEQSWLDEGADSSKRPDAAFTLTSSSGDYTFVYDAGAIVSARSSDCPDRKLYKRVSSGELESLTGYTGSGYDVAISSADDSMTFKLDKNADSSSFAIANLPKYDSQGALVDWKVDGAWIGEHGDYEMISGGDVTVDNGAWHHGDKLAFSFTNKRVGTKDVTFHAKWFDHFVKDGNGERPALLLKLYRLKYEYGTDGQTTGTSTLEEVPASEYVSDCSWSSSDAADRVPNDTDAGDFTKFVTFSNLPKYDDHGKMCVYYARPSLSASQGVAAGQNYSYEQSVSKDNYSKDPGSWGSADPEFSGAAESAAISDSSIAYREDSTFNFHITGSMRLAGSVQWSNIPEGQSDELPDVSVYAQRRLVAGSYDSSGVWNDGAGAITPWSNLSLTADASVAKGYTVASSDTGRDNDNRAITDGLTAVAWTSDLSKSGNTWNYAITNFGDNIQAGNSNSASKLDAFDSEGRLFEYRVREVIDGAVGSAAFDASKFASSSAGSNPEDAFAKLYETSYDGCTITNVYCSAKGSLTVNELFEGVDVHPDASFRLYRFWQNSSNKSELKYASEVKLSNYDAGSKSVVFGDLDVYTLSGEKWKYVPVEVVPNSFTSTSALGSAESAVPAFKDSASWVVSNGVSLPTDVTGDLSMGPAVEFGDGALQQNVVFKNVFDAGTATLKGAINWIDREDVFGTRPSDFETALKLTRARQDGAGGDDLALQSSNPNAANYLLWTAQPSGNGDSWAYEIRNVERTAPDLKPWKYTLEEDLSKTQYKLAFDSSASVSFDAASGEFPSVSNELKGQVGFATSWGGDSGVRWLQRPAVRVVLEARESDSDGDWARAASFFADHGVSLTDTSEFEMGGGAQESAAAWRHLPLSLRATDGSVIDIEYRVVASSYSYGENESTIKVSLNCAKDGSYSVDGTSSFSSYLPEAQTVNQPVDGVWQYSIVNAYKGGSITANATYSWNDGENAFNTRPDGVGEAMFVLQRSADGGNTWQWVGRGGNVVSEPFVESGLNSDLLVTTVTGLSPDVSVDGLPAKGIGASGEEIAYQYRLAALVSGSYEVKASTVEAVSSDGLLRLEVVEPDNGVQNFVNELMTTTISGDVTWNDYGSGLSESLDPAVLDAKLVVARGIANGSDVTSVDQLETVSHWSKNAENAWSYSLAGLPKLDQSGHEYAYNVIGCKNMVPGWYFAGSGNNGAIAFDASRLAFDVFDAGSGSDGSSVAKLNGIAFELTDASGKVAIWSRNGDGVVSVSVESGFGQAGAGDSNGWIIGLPAGEYTVHEATVPAGYEAVDDFKIVILEDGAVSLVGNPARVTLNNDGFTVAVGNAKKPAPSVPSGGSGSTTGGNDKPNNPDKPDDPGGAGAGNDGDKFVSEPALDIAGSAAEDGVVTPSISATFISADGKSKVTLSSDANQLEIELIDVATGTCKVTIKPGCEPAGYKGELSDAAVVNLFEGKTVSLEEVQKATGSTSGYATYRGDDGTVYKVVIPKDNIKVTAPKKTLKASSLKKGKKKFELEVTDAKGKVTYKSSSKKWVKVSKKGVVTVRKGAKKGSYKITVISQATDTHAKAVKYVKFKVK